MAPIANTPLAPPSPIVFAGDNDARSRRSAGSFEDESIVLDISAPLDETTAATSADAAADADYYYDKGERKSVDDDADTISEGRHVGTNVDVERAARDADSSPPPSPGIRETGMRVLGVNYFPPVKEEKEEDTPHPLRLDMPSPVLWAHVADEDTAEGEEGEEWKGSSPGRRGVVASFGRQQEISVTRRTRPPESAYPFGPPAPDAAFGTDPVGRLGVHHPREIVRVERDYSGGEIVQFAQAYPLEFEGRVTPTQFLETINAFNEILISAYSLRHGFVDNALDILTLRLARLVVSTHYDREMRRLRRTMDTFNAEVFNPAGLNILWPRRVGFLFLEIEYY